MRSLIQAMIFGFLDFLLVVGVVFFVKNKYFVILTILIAQVAYLAYLITLLETKSKEKKEAEEKRVEEAIVAKKREDQLKKELKEAKEKPKEVAMKSMIINYSQLKNYIGMNINKFSEQDLRRALLNSGWSLSMINKAFYDIKIRKS